MTKKKSILTILAMAAENQTEFSPKRKVSLEEIQDREFIQQINLEMMQRQAKVKGHKVFQIKDDYIVSLNQKNAVRKYNQKHPQNHVNKNKVVLLEG